MGINECMTMNEVLNGTLRLLLKVLLSNLIQRVTHFKGTVLIQYKTAFQQGGGENLSTMMCGQLTGSKEQSLKDIHCHLK